MADIPATILHTHCWLCGDPIGDPPRVVGHIVGGTRRLAHRHCWRTLGEHELDLTGH